MNKFNQWMRSFGRLVLGFALVVTAHPSFKVLAAEKQLTVIGISDLHGALQVERLETLNQQKVERGGASWIASIIQAIKKNTAGPVVIVDAGDMFQGTLVSNSAEGEPVIRFYNFLGVDAAALGNHEFDYGPIGPASYASESIGSDPREALKARIQQANFPLLAANIIDEATHTTPTWAKPSLFIERQGVKIGIVGGATTLTPSTTDKRNLVGLKFLPEAEPLLKEAISLRQRGADFVILTAHIGGGCKDNRSGQEAVLESCRFQDIFHLLDQMPEHTFDFVLGGHTHQQINKMYRGSIILQPAANGSFLALAKLKKSPKQIKTTQELIPVCSAGIKTTDGFSCEPNDLKNFKGELTIHPLLAKVKLNGANSAYAKVEKLLANDFARVDSILNRSLAVTSAERMEHSFQMESPVANLVVDTIASAMQRRGEKFDLVLVNNGGVRDDLPPGLVTFGKIYKILPFDNNLAFFEVDGATLSAITTYGISGKHGGLTWHGLTFQADACKITNLRVAGKPVRDRANYRIIANTYLAAGGSGFDQFIEKFKQLRVLENIAMYDVVANEISLQAGKELKVSNYFDPQHRRFDIKTSCKQDK